MKFKYRPGDVVRIYPKNPLYAHLRNTTVTIKARRHDFLAFPCYDVEEHPGYALDERCITDHARREEKVVITTDGHRTVAKFYNGKNLIRTAEARLDPRDDFDFATGARLAFFRLMPSTVAPDPGSIPKFAPMQQCRIRSSLKLPHHIRPNSVVTITRVLANGTYCVTGPAAVGHVILSQSVHEDDLTPLKEDAR